MAREQESSTRLLDYNFPLGQRMMQDRLSMSNSIVSNVNTLLSQLQDKGGVSKNQSRNNLPQMGNPQHIETKSEAETKILASIN
mmetsp:Transcript_41935/g.64197  ORF Transcript_41935/g.64197 Transcript_41935/m.64197 type:complete len:84 (+) Transcript_41935:1369-1620(+)